MRTLVQDLRYGLRVLVKNPGFTGVVVLSLTLGIGATTAIFSVINGVMLRPLTYPEAERTMLVGEISTRGERISVSWPNFLDWRDQNRVFESLGIWRGTTLNLTGVDQPDRLVGGMASSAVFQAMGIQPLMGRVFASEEDSPGANRVAIISERLWRNRFGSDPYFLGKPIKLNGESFNVIGVMPATMQFPSRATDVWLPLGLYVDQFPRSRDQHPGLNAVGRLKPHVTVQQAVAEMETIAQRLAKAYPQTNGQLRVSVIPLPEQIVQNVRPALLVLLGAVSMMLLIACTNLVSITLARAERRQREITIRAALGASRGRLIQQLLTECFLLAGAGGGLGLLLSVGGVHALLASNPSFIPRIDQITLDLRVFAFTALVSMLTGVAFGLVPALRVSRTKLQTSVTDAARSSPGRHSGKVRSMLVVSEIAVALVLLIGAGLLIRSFQRLISVDLGFNPEHVLTLRTSLPDVKYPGREQWTNFHRELLRRLGNVTGVQAIGISNTIPLTRVNFESGVIAEGHPVPMPNEPGAGCLFHTVSASYFQAMGIPLLKGRFFTEEDRPDSAPVVIVDEKLAGTFWPNEDPLGKRVAFEFLGTTRDDLRPIWRQIIGVAPHVKHYGLAVESPRVQIYTPYTQLPFWFRERRPSMALAIRTTLPPEALTSTIRREVSALDPDLPIFDIRTMDQLVSQQTEQSRMTALLMSVFATVALALAIVGIYGVLAYAVVQRTQEFGIRMTLGASPREVVKLVVRQGLTLVLVGLTIGLAAAFALTRALSRLLYGVRPTDAATFAAVAVSLGAVGLMACYIPARRATQVDPVVALRYE